MKEKFLLVFPVVLFIAYTLNAQIVNYSDTLDDTGLGSYEILNKNNEPIKIPFKMHNGKPLMDLEINGIKSTLMIDNGVLWDQVWLFGSPLVEELQLIPIEESEIGGAGEGDPTQAYTSDNLTLKFQEIIFYDQPVLVSPPAAGFAKMFPGADGQLCNTFFKHFLVEFDFINNEVILHNPKHFRYNGHGSVLDMLADEIGTYSIPFAFTMLDGKTYSDRVDIDFGGIYPLKIALNNKYNIQLPSNAKETFSYGAQGKSSEFSGDIQSMTIGKYTFNNLTAYFGDEETSRIHPGNLGVIGLPLFMKFNIIFDYFSNKLYIEPNKDFTNSFDLIYMSANDSIDEGDLIKEAVEQYYIRGLQTRDFTLIRTICINEARLYGVRKDSSLNETTLDQWSKRFDPDNPPFKSLEYNIQKIDFAGTAAQVKILFIINGNTDVYDFLNLLKIEGSWRIVNIIDY